VENDDCFGGGKSKSLVFSAADIPENAENRGSLSAAMR
jgi:hypothetical protein